MNLWFYSSIGSETKHEMRFTVHHHFLGITWTTITWQSAGATSVHVDGNYVWGYVCPGATPDSYNLTYSNSSNAYYVLPFYFTTNVNVTGTNCTHHSATSGGFSGSTTLCF